MIISELEKNKSRKVNLTEDITIYTGSNGKKGCLGNCIGCSQESYGTQHPMYQGNLKQIETVLERSPVLKSAIILGNPDPAVDTEFCNQVAKKLTEKGIKVRFSSSGKNCSKMIQKLIDGVDHNYIEYISFSIDTVEQEMLDYIKGTHIDLEELRETISYLNKKEIEVKIQPTIWNINEDTCIDTIEYFEKQGVKWFSFHAGSFETLGDKQKEKLKHIEPIKWRKEFSKIVNKCNESNLKLHIPYLFVNKEEMKEYISKRGPKCVPEQLKNTQIWLEENYIRTTHCPLLNEVQNFHYNYLDMDKSKVDYSCSEIGVCPAATKALGEELCRKSTDGKGHFFTYKGEQYITVCRSYNYVNFERNK